MPIELGGARTSPTGQSQRWPSGAIRRSVRTAEGQESRVPDHYRALWAYGAHSGYLGGKFNMAGFKG
jgi:hypothetical protein